MPEIFMRSAPSVTWCAAGGASEGISPCRVARRSSQSSTGEIGIDVIGKPSASSMAEAMTADTGMQPASPAPLMPSGFSGRRRLEVVGLDVRHLGRVGHEEVHERGVEQLPRLVVGHPLVERAADALGDAAVDLALDDHRVDHRRRSRG